MRRDRAVSCIALLALTALACSLTEVARDALGRLPTSTPSATALSGIDHWYLANDGTDGGPCSETEPCLTLRHVLSRATDRDEIFIGPGTYTEPGLSDETIVAWGIFDKRLTIVGDGADSTILDAENLRMVFRLSGSGSVTFRELTLRNGGGTSRYGRCLWIEDRISAVLEDVIIENCERAGIEHNGTSPLLLDNVVIRNVSSSPRGTGANLLMSYAPVMIRGGEFTDSERYGIQVRADLDMRGGLVARTGLTAIVIEEGLLDGVTLQEPGPSPFGSGPNHPPGIEVNNGGRVELREISAQGYGDCVTVNERANPLIVASDLVGCGIKGLWVHSNASATLRASRVISNGAPLAGRSHAGGIWNQGTLTIEDSLVQRNHGFGIRNEGSLTLFDSWVDDNILDNGLINRGTAMISGSTFTGADSPYIGILNYGQMTLVNSTVSGNEKYGIMAVSGNLILRHVTITDNGEEGLVARDASSKIELIENTLVAGNGPDGDCAFYGDFSIPSLAGVNLASDGSCSFGAMDSRLRLTMEDLADNGGPTMTHALHSDSGAVDAISGACTSVDQRGARRPAGAGCDVGAFELSPQFVREEISEEGTPQPPVTVTPQTQTSLPRVVEESLCWHGPGPQYEVVSALEAGTVVEILGRGVEGDWWVIDSPRFPGVPCWVEDEDLSVDPLIELEGLRIFTIPPLPTPTATPILGCLYQGQNDNQAACYPIDQCPVDFEDSQGACTP